MRESADAKYDGAMAQAGLQIAGGAMSLCSSAADANNATGAKMTYDSLGTGTKAGSDFAKAYGEHKAAGHDIEAKAAANEASTAKRAQDDARDLEKDAKDLMNRVMSFYKEYVTSKEDATKAALHRARAGYLRGRGAQGTSSTFTKALARRARTKSMSLSRFR